MDEPELESDAAADEGVRKRRKNCWRMQVGGVEWERGGRGSPLRDLPEWLEEFTDNLVDEEASTSGEAPASISREALHQEPPIKVVSGKHSNFSRTSRKTEIVKFGRGRMLQGLLAESAPADHKVLCEDCESRNDHPYAVVVQYLAAQWLQIVSVQNIIFSRQKEFTKVSRTDSQSDSHLTITLILPGPI